VTVGARRIARDWLPPAVVRKLTRGGSGALTFSDGFESWEAASASAEGYDAPSILRQVTAATERASTGEVAFERDGITFDEPETRWPVAAALLMAANRSGGRLRVLDFGGSLGSVYWQHRRLLSDIELSWGVVEQQDFIREGARFANSELSFHPSIDEFLSAGKPDLILLSSVLQYLSAPHEILESLSATGATYLLIDRTPVSALTHDIATVQRVPEQIYKASYPAWILSESQLLESLSDRWTLIEDFPGIEPDMATSTGVSFSWRGYLFTGKFNG
jgi:putative methyltransferase (TIGR04325 family)